MKDDKSKKIEAAKAEASKAQVSEAETKAYEKALADVCKMLGTSVEELKANQEAKEKAQEMAEYDIGNMTVRINGEIYPSKGVAPRATVENIMAMAGARRMRILRESIRHDWMIQQLAGGGFTSRLIKSEPV